MRERLVLRLILTIVLFVSMLSFVGCASTPSGSPRPFDPSAFLKNLHPTGEGTCRLSNGHETVFSPCKSFEDESGSNVYLAIYHPTLGYLLAIKEIRPDGTQGNVWNRPTPAVVPAKQKGTTT